MASRLGRQRRPANTAVTRGASGGARHPEGRGSVEGAAVAGAALALLPLLLRLAALDGGAQLLLAAVGLREVADLRRAEWGGAGRRVG